MSVASRAILSHFFGEQGRQNHPQYLSGLSRVLFPTRGANGVYHGQVENRESKKCGTTYCLRSKLFWQDKTAVGLAQSVERLTVEQEVVGLIPGTDHYSRS